MKHLAVPLLFGGLFAGALHGQAEVNFADHISPLIRENCVTCHNPGGIGPFSLTTFEEVKRRARQISEVTASRYMPPWKPDPGFGPPLQGERRLPEDSIRLIDQWVKSGSPSGDLSKLPPATEVVSTWKLGEPDLIIELTEAYTLPAAGLDVYRNFVIPMPTTEKVYIRAFELLPETRLAIHHALLMFDPTERSRQQDASEAGPGYDGMGIGSSVPPSGHIVGWTPGQVPYQAFPGTAWELEPGTDIVLQLHMLPSGKPETINPKIGLYLSDEPPTIPSFVFQLRSYELDIPAGDSDYLVEQSMAVTADLKVISVYPHAHYIGKDMQLFARLPDGTKQWLLRISDWDFNWQGDYRYKEPLFLPAGSVIHMAYHFDNSANNPRNPFTPPREIRGGWRSEDEMAEAMIQVIPVDPDDLPKLIEAQKAFDYKLAGGEARFHYFSGIYLEQQNEMERAVASYKQALDLDPGFASAYYRLGSLMEKEDPYQAEELYKTALAHEPKLIPARLAIAKLMMQKNQIRPAGFILEEVYAENPNHLQACLYLTRYHLTRGEVDKALNTFKDGERFFSDSPQFHLEYGQALISSDRAAAEARLRKAVETIPEQLEQGAQKPLKMVQSEALYHLALLYEKDGNLDKVELTLDQCLDRNADHLDALLKSAELALRNGDREKSFKRLYSLINRPPDKTFAYQDILENLGLPSGALVLADVYQALGKEQTAADSLAHGIRILREKEAIELISPLQEQLELMRTRNLKP